MAKNKRKATASVGRRHVASPVTIVSPKGNDHDGDSSGVLAPTVSTEVCPDDVARRQDASSSVGGTNGPASVDQRPHLSSGAGANGPLAGSLEAIHYNNEELVDKQFEADVGPDEEACAPSSAHPSRDESPAMAVASGSRLLDAVLVEDCSGGSDDEIIGEDQLDLNFSDEDCDSPQGPELPAPPLTSPLIPSEKVHSFSLPQSDMPRAPTFESAPPPPGAGITPGPSISKWRDVLFSNRTSCTRLKNFSLNHLSKSCDISHEDIMSQFDIWNVCAVGYISGRSPGFKALNGIISTVWKTEATLTIHETGWLIYRFKTEEEKLAVLRGGPYLVYGRPLVLRPMSKFFDFSSEEMSRVPVWVKFPCLPLCCWSPICLSKIASVIGKPIQCDQLTSNLSRMSYARVLIEIDLLEELRHSVEISLPDGLALHQKVVYESLPKYCNFCHVLGHSRLLCPKAAAASNLVSSSHPQTQAAPSAKGNAFSRLGPQISHQDAPPTPPVQSQRKHSKKPGPSPKGKEVAVSETRVDAPSSPICPETVWPLPPSIPVPLVVPSCDGEDLAPPPNVVPVVAQVSAVEISHPVAMAGKTDIAPSLDVSARNGVRTRNQKNRDRGGRVPPSSTLP
uniref:DUF4283 domain-containing protein n=1 Tax=Populus alba TaxID=43335 RepID=A0A4U5R1H2_POPAL|nr:hypothetical protein D5086_0000013040 [Populus alba]